MRLDGESWECDPNSSMKMCVNNTDDFEGWDEWKQFNRGGYEAKVTFGVRDNMITIATENDGISIRNTAVLTDIERPVYAAITGDQVAITNIRAPLKTSCRPFAPSFSRHIAQKFLEIRRYSCKISVQSAD